MAAMELQNKVVLVIMDGWGEAPATASNAIAAAHTPFIDNCYKNYLHAQLLTDGENVGLPDGQMGNSEVGHMNIGAGRVVYQELARLNMAVRDDTMGTVAAFRNTIDYCKQNNRPLHIMGLVSDGGVHSHISHLYYLIKAAHQAGLHQVFIHAFTDGRDTDPKSGIKFLSDLQKFIDTNNFEAKIVSISGRYYGMDRDKRWERVALAYHAIVNGVGAIYTSVNDAIHNAYDNNITDEFVKPCLISTPESGIITINERDAVLCFNFRTDRCREITEVLTQKSIPEHGMSPLPLHYVTMARYDEHYVDVQVMYEKENLNDTLGEVLASANKSQLRMAETEKYPHVTFFFSGGREEPFMNEQRILVASPKVATYDLQPEMSAVELKNKFLEAIDQRDFDFICINFANPDMVGHTGVYDAVKQAVATVDKCVEEMVVAATYKGYSFIIIADHGNAEYMINEDGTPNTAHTTNPVPMFVIDSRVMAVSNGKLADVAPTILEMLGIAPAGSMSGKSLVTLQTTTF